MEDAPLLDLAALCDRLETWPHKGRRIVAIAGPPGSGKSTIAEELVARANGSKPGSAALLPMDGYHYDDILLDQKGRTANKGAPDTFDVGGLEQILERLARRDESEVAVPVFDRSLEIARSGARLILQSVDIIVVEGNYLLLKDPPWGRLRRLFDLAIMVEVPRHILHVRLLQRWLDHGFSPEAARRKAAMNDIPNGGIVVERSGSPEFRISGLGG